MSIYTPVLPFIAFPAEKVDATIADRFAVFQNVIARARNHWPDFAHSLVQGFVRSFHCDAQIDASLTLSCKDNTQFDFCKGTGPVGSVLVIRVPCFSAFDYHQHSPPDPPMIGNGPCACEGTACIWHEGGGVHLRRLYNMLDPDCADDFAANMHHTHATPSNAYIEFVCMRSKTKVGRPVRRTFELTLHGGIEVQRKGGGMYQATFTRGK